jgi:hypothetical protein
MADSGPEERAYTMQLLLPSIDPVTRRQLAAAA